MALLGWDIAATNPPRRRGSRRRGEKVDRIRGRLPLRFGSVADLLCLRSSAATPVGGVNGPATGTQEQQQHAACSQQQLQLALEAHRFEDGKTASEDESQGQHHNRNDAGSRDAGKQAKDDAHRGNALADAQHPHTGLGVSAG